MITVIGSLNMDLVTYTPHFPRAGETITSIQYEELSGGKGANQAVAIAKLGGNVTLLGAIGNDTFGHKLIATLNHYNVNTSDLKKCDTLPTGTAFINVDTSCGDNKIILVPGANHGLFPDDITLHNAIINQSRCVVLQLEIPLETVVYSLKYAKSLQKLTILNPAPACKLDYSIFQYVDILTPNESELEILTGHPTNTLEDIHQASLILLSYGVQTVITTLGEKGAAITDANGLVHIPPHQVSAIDTTAAGDAFTGALALALTNGSSLYDACIFANKVGALTVQKKGAQISLPTLAEVLA